MSDVNIKVTVMTHRVSIVDSRDGEQVTIYATSREDAHEAAEIFDAYIEELQRGDQQYDRLSTKMEEL